MRKMTRHVLGAAGLALIVTTSVVWAQEAQPVRVRGEIAKVEGNTLSIKSRDGQNLTVKLADNARIAAMVKASLADIKEGAFIGVSAMPQPDGTQKAFAIHIFMDSQRGVVADRHTPWDSRPGSTMTNANVATTVAGKEGQDLLVKYKDGEKKVIVPPRYADCALYARKCRGPQGRSQDIHRRGTKAAAWIAHGTQRRRWS